MKKILTIAVLTLALAACGGQSGNNNGGNTNSVEQNIDECPRADGTPCR